MAGTVCGHWNLVQQNAADLLRHFASFCIPVGMKTKPIGSAILAFDPELIIAVRSAIETVLRVTPHFTHSRVQKELDRRGVPYDSETIRSLIYREYIDDESGLKAKIIELASKHPNWCLGDLISHLKASGYPATTSNTSTILSRLRAYRIDGPSAPCIGPEEQSANTDIAFVPTEKGRLVHKPSAHLIRPTVLASRIKRLYKENRFALGINGVPLTSDQLSTFDSFMNLVISQLKHLETRSDVN